MDRGMGIDATVQAVRLPEAYRRLPYLQEFYGTVAWSVRSIYTGYLGWFDGNPTNLNPLAPHQRAARTIEQMGGNAAVAQAVDRALRAGESQWALELADLLLALEPDRSDVRSAKAEALMDLARQETSANGRHYYIACARELLEPIP
jgi:alkyl sulfatase BDS1-like metallo-beta-lactamase superfamily hydrolase